MDLRKKSSHSGFSIHDIMISQSDTVSSYKPNSESVKSRHGYSNPESLDWSKRHHQSNNNMDHNNPLQGHFRSPYPSGKRVYNSDFTAQSEPHNYSKSAMHESYNRRESKQQQQQQQMQQMQQCRKFDPYRFEDHRHISQVNYLNNTRAIKQRLLNFDQKENSQNQSSSSSIDRSNENDRGNSWQYSDEQHHHHQQQQREQFKVERREDEKNEENCTDKENLDRSSSSDDIKSNLDRDNNTMDNNNSSRDQPRDSQHTTDLDYRNDPDSSFNDHDDSMMTVDSDDDSNEDVDDDDDDDEEVDILSLDQQDSLQLFSPVSSSGGHSEESMDGSPGGRGSRRSLTDVGSSDHNKKVYRCTDCKYVTDRKNNLKRHIVTMHEECQKTLECCDKVFPNKAAIREHVLACHKHGYDCKTCGRNFCRKALLKRHITVHSGQKDYVCHVCGYATSHKSNLDRHKRRHLPKEPERLPSLPGPCKPDSDRLALYLQDRYSNFMDGKLAAQHAQRSTAPLQSFPRYPHETSRRIPDVMTPTKWGGDFRGMSGFLVPPPPFVTTPPPARLDHVEQFMYRVGDKEYLSYPIKKRKRLMPSLYTCKLCERVFANQLQLNLHTEGQHHVIKKPEPQRPLTLTVKCQTNGVAIFH